MNFRSGIEKLHGMRRGEALRISIAKPSDNYLATLVRFALKEDIGQGDITSQAVIDEDRLARAQLVARQPQVIAGLPLLEQVFAELDPTVEVTPIVGEGQEVAAGTIVAKLEGPARSLLSGERVALNFMQRLSGIATLTRRFVVAMGGARTVLLDTRKTTPLLRAIEKYAVTVGGGANHRSSLDDAYLIKENHIRAAGGIGKALERAFRHSGNPERVEIEVTSEDELIEALKAGARWILLDNMTTGQIERCVQVTAGRARLEASGGISLDNVAAYAATGVDSVSVGALTHSAPSTDLSFLITIE